MVVTSYDYLKSNDELKRQYGINTADDDKFYLIGGSGKEFVYNPETQNIGVNNGGVIRYVLKDDDEYDVTFKAMEDDTGISFRGGNTRPQGLTGQASAANDTDNLNPNQETISYLRQQEEAELTGLREQINQVRLDAEAEKARILAAQGDANRSLYTQRLKENEPYGYHAEKRALMGLSSSGHADSEEQKLWENYQRLADKNGLSAGEMLAGLQASLDKALTAGDGRRAEIIQRYFNLIADQVISGQQAFAATVPKQSGARQIDYSVPEIIQPPTPSPAALVKESVNAAAKMLNNLLPANIVSKLLSQPEVVKAMENTLVKMLN